MYNLYSAGVQACLAWYLPSAPPGLARGNGICTICLLLEYQPSPRQAVFYTLLMSIFTAGRSAEQQAPQAQAVFQV